MTYTSTGSTGTTPARNILVINIAGMETYYGPQSSITALLSLCRLQPNDRTSEPRDDE